MKVAFLLQSLGLWGGVGVVVTHARRLRAEYDIDARLVLSRRERAADWAHLGLDDVPVLTLDDARDERWDVAVATWWETTMAFADIAAERYAYFVQSLEDRFYGPGEPERGAAALTHALPVAMLTEAHWIADELQALRPGLSVPVVRNGIDKEVFVIPDEPPAHEGPLRILVEGSPAVWLKGVPEALAACAAMREPHTVTLVCADRAAAEGAQADRVVGPLSPPDMAALYADTDVVLKLSRVEGMAMPPLEGFHRGATCVVTPVTGHEEYVVDGVNGLLVSYDDERGCARTLDLVARDRELLQKLRTAALDTARAWPSWNDAAAEMAAALRAVAAAPDPDPTRAVPRLVAESRAAMEAHAAQRRDQARLQQRVDRVERMLSRGPLKLVRRAAGRR
jgi:glycosyltransferase involved in cell wall biosynthesis